MAKFLNFPNQQSESRRFEAIVSPYFGDLFNAARRFTMNETDAHDLVQEVFLKAFLRMDELERIEYRRAWLMRVLYNQFIDTCRANKRSPDHAVNSVEFDDEAPQIDNASLQTEDRVDQIQNIERVLRAMEILGQEQCALLAMHDVDGFSIRELAELTGHSEALIKSRIFRTRVKLGRLLKNPEVSSPVLRIVGGSQ